jgi:hypothetical protein
LTSRAACPIDIASLRPGGARYPNAALAPLVEEAREAGLGVTIHVGEEGDEHGIAEIGEVVESVAPTGSATASSPPATPS